MSPVSNKNKIFESKEDIYRELEMCYDELIQKNTDNIGETLYIEHFFFCNTEELVDENYQQRIKEYNFCKTFKTAPFQSLNQTPANIVDDFLLIDKEINLYKSSKRRN